MNPSGSKQNEHEVQNQSFPEWLGLFLQTIFFSPCGIHVCLKNELRYYCLDCKASACKHCLDAGLHQEHKVLKVYRHVYRDAVLQTDMENLIDCAYIQAYKCNKRMVFTTTPIPHNGSQTSREISCRTCMRKLYDPIANRFCSIICKVQESATDFAQGPMLSFRKKPRKGIPHRAVDQ